MLLWAVFLAALGATAIVVFQPSDPATPALFAGMTFLMLLIGGYLLARRGGKRETGDRSVRVVPDSSVATALVAISVAALALSAEVGFWLALVAAGMLAVGVGGLVRESRASREMADQWLRSREAAAPPEGRGPRFEAPGEK